MNQDLIQIKQELADIKGMLRQLLRPAANLSVQAKAEAVKRAMSSGDQKQLREVLKQINGEA